jgi:hypothetical protein
LPMSGPSQALGCVHCGFGLQRVVAKDIVVA